MNGMIRLALCALVGWTLTAQGTPMDAKAKVLKTVKSALSGTVEITCDDPGTWSFDITAGTDDGRDVVTVMLSSPEDAVPPEFGVFFRVPGAGVRNVWTPNFERAAFKVDPQLWWSWASKYTSQLARDMPVAVGFGPDETAPVAIACSEAFNYLEFALYADDRTCEMIGRCEFFRQPVAARRSYQAKILLDRRGKKWYEAVRSCADWIVSENGFTAADVPETAYDPLYSTWYAYLQDVHDKTLEKEARHAAAIGMKTMILDDGWQKEDSRNFYSATGDWMPVKSRFPDMKAHVAEVHRAGLKYMLWLGVPMMGVEAKNYPKFKDMLLEPPSKGSGDVANLDPRFPEVREYLISTYERVVRDWGFDGVKLDFIDSFMLPNPDRAVAENYAGRDYRSLPEAVDRLMKDVLARLKAINPEVLVEFRQHYMGPAMRQYGNMMRAADCPDDICSNRRRICDLRLTSGKTAVHSDMLVWSRDETPEGAALSILSALFGTVQYSMILDTVRPEHKEVIRHWIDFTTRHRETLLKGDLRPHHPESGYSWIEAESAEERIVAVYSPSVCADVGEPDKTAYVVNATGSSFVQLHLRAVPTKVESFDTFGKPAAVSTVGKGRQEVFIPPSGYLKLTFASAPTPEVRIADLFERYVRSGRVAGVVSVLSDADYSTSFVCDGWADCEAGRQMAPDVLFAIFSMTKTFTGAAIMCAIDEGKMSLDDEVSKYLPEFADIKMKDGSKPKRPLTVRDLMSHVTGFRGGYFVVNRDKPLREVARLLAAQPLEFQPGETFAYGNSWICSAAACLEVAVSEPFEKYLAHKVLEPLGMKDTTFWPNEAQLKRLVKAYTTDDGPLRLGRDYCSPQLEFPKKAAVFPAASGGLFSTPRDMIRFSQMLAHHGEWMGKTIISRKTFDGVFAVKQTPTGIKEPYSCGCWIYGDWLGHEGAMRTDQRANLKTGQCRVFFIQTENAAGRAFFELKKGWHDACDRIQGTPHVDFVD